MLLREGVFASRHSTVQDALIFAPTSNLSLPPSYMSTRSRHSAVLFAREREENRFLGSFPSCIRFFAFLRTASYHFIILIISFFYSDLYYDYMYLYKVRYLCGELSWCEAVGEH